MKKSLLFLLFLAFSTVMVAQQTPRIEQLGNQKRRETYTNRFGYDSVRFTILGQNDTFLAETLRENGRISQQDWRKDSAHRYDVFGRLRDVFYLHDPIPKGSPFKGPNIHYHFNGALSKRRYKTPTGATVLDYFDRKGDFIHREMWQELTPSVNYMVKTDNQYRIISAIKNDSGNFKRDSIVMVYDTTFYDNGRILSLAQYKKKEGSKDKTTHYTAKQYLSDGTLFIDALPDSLMLTPFKDNVDCYYGLKNKRGDTIYPPRFDQLELLDFEGELWKAKEGTKVVLIRKDGKIIAPSLDDVTSIELSRDGGIGYFYPNGESNSIYYSSVIESYNLYLNIKVGDKFGLIDRQGVLVLPPQYPPFILHDSAYNFFEVRVPDKNIDSDADKIHRIVDRQGKYLFENRYPNLELTGLAGFFVFSPVAKSDTNHWEYIGLVNESGETLLDASYYRIEANRENNLFLVAKGTESYDNWGKKTFENLVYGLFDPIQRRWVLPCVYQMHSADSYGIVLTNTKTHKMGITSRSGQVILPFVYDTIISFEEHYYNIYVVVKNGRYQIYDLVKQKLGKEVYQCLHPVTIWYEDGSFFIAQKKDKWGLLDPMGDVFVPFDYDYAGYATELVAMVKGNRADIMSNTLFPLPEPEEMDKIAYFSSRTNLQSFTLAGDEAKKVFIVNLKNRVLFPPKYHVLRERYDWYLLEDASQKRVLLFTETETSLPFPFKEKLIWASQYSPLGILSDDLEKHFEVVNLRTFQKYQSINAGGVGADFKTGTHFVKIDAPVVEPVLDMLDMPTACQDTFLIDDTHWKMYDSLGKPLTDKEFRYPIDFSEGIGIGAVGDKFGIWRTDGSEIVPPQYENAHFVANNKFVVLYQNMGLKNWLLLVESTTGKSRIGTGRYDGISDFYGKYALVSLGDKIGLVDTVGREIITPTLLENDAINLMDSLNRASIEYMNDSTYYMVRTQDLPIELSVIHGFVVSPNKLNLSNALRNRVWHYLLQTQVGTCINRADFRDIRREKSVFKTYTVYLEQCNRLREINILRYLFVDSLHISFALLSDSAAKSNFKNYWYTKSGWQTQQLSDILSLSRDNTIKINNLMRQKLRALNDKNIDCGESSSFVERTQNTFLTTPEGLSFYFTSEGFEEGATGSFHYVPIHLTWAELKAFRRF